jgi:aromatic-L-amino-acid decarboxylase
MFTNFDCNCFYVADRGALTGALGIQREYLRTAEYESGAAIDYRDWQIPLGRRFRSLKLWFVLRHYGAEGLAHHIREHVELAKQFERWVDDHSNFELIVPRTLNTVCFCHRLGDSITERILESVNSTGRMYVSHTKLADRYTIRMVVGGRDTKLRHVEQAWSLITQTAEEMDSE